MFSSRFDRELKRLECTVKFKGSDSGRGKEWEGRVNDLSGDEA